MSTIAALQTHDAYLSLSKASEKTDQSSASSVGSSSNSSENAVTSDTVALSAEATAALADATTTTTDPQVSYYAQFFPTRSGSSAIFGENVIDPAATTISTGLSAAGIAKAARASMDSQYSAMAASGKPFDYDSAGGTDWYTLMSGLDRTALAAVSSNQGGLFSTREQDMAQYIMLQQEGLATGGYSGPLDLESKFVTQPVSGQDYSTATGNVPIGKHTNINQSALSYIENISLYLDKAGSYEKSTVGWAFDRASAQTSYEMAMDAANQPDDPKYISNLSIVGMLTELMKNGQKLHLVNHPSVMNISDLLNEEWAKGHEDEITNALKKTREELGYAQS
ncbi:hypothetical protein [Komagataeibacter rhaeticus]|uniref:hypothetical protein n=1 Tax=Komagataeibacter rhaeticus TaxID=215221 RepID=UPI001CD643AE|nr:hypothetical protein [Komagataeibacter rhaeticus]